LWPSDVLLIVGLLEGFVHYRRGAGGLFSHSATPLLQSLLDTTRNSWTLKSIVASMTPAQDDKDVSLTPHVLASSRGMYTWDFGQLRSRAPYLLGI